MTILTARYSARPAAVLLTGYDWLALHHVIWVTVKLHKIPGLVHSLALYVAILWYVGFVTGHLYKRIYEHVHKTLQLISQIL